MSKPAAVLDTQVILRALINPHSACGAVFYDYSSRYTRIASVPIVAEIMDVIRRPDIRVKFRQITDETVQSIYALLLDSAFVNVEPIEPASRDPKDDKFLACAKAAGADFLVSEDYDLLVLKEYGKTRIVSALMFLDALKSAEQQNG